MAIVIVQKKKTTGYFNYGLIHFLNFLFCSLCHAARPCCVRNKTRPPSLRGPKDGGIDNCDGRETRFSGSEFNFVVDKHAYNKMAKRRNRLYRRRKNWVSNKSTLTSRGNEGCEVKLAAGTYTCTHSYTYT